MVHRAVDILQKLYECKHNELGKRVNYKSKSFSTADEEIAHFQTMKISAAS